jgi:hypothetical protein
VIKSRRIRHAEHVYIYIYKEREREKEEECTKSVNQKTSSGKTTFKNWA